MERSTVTAVTTANPDDVSPLDVEAKTDDCQLAELFCRLCLRELPNLFPLRSRLRDVPLEEMLAALTGIEISPRDEELPRKVCSQCLTKLDMAFSVRREFLESDEALRRICGDAQRRGTHLMEQLSRYQGEMQLRQHTEELLSECSETLRTSFERRALLDECRTSDEVDEGGTDGKSCEMEVETVDDSVRNDEERAEDVCDEPCAIEEEMTLSKSEPTHDRSPSPVRESMEPVEVKVTRKKGKKSKFTFSNVTDCGTVDYNKCYICGQTFTVRSELDMHLGTHNDLVPYRCEECAKEVTVKEITTVVSVNRHMRVHSHPYKCPDCPYRFVNKHNVYIHHRMYHNSDNPEIFTCEDCGKSFNTKKNFLNHRRFHRNVADARYECVVCSHRFGTKARLTRHERQHTGEKPFRCPFCANLYCSQDGLQIHIRRHTGEKGYRCHICTKRFICKRLLTLHLELHVATTKEPDGVTKTPTAKPASDGYKYKCQYSDCSFESTNYQATYHHRKTHELPHECTECDRRFPSKQSLEQHSIVHSGEKPFVCHMCGKDFRFRTSFKEHVASHEGIRPYSCDDCGMSFVRERTLKEHRLKHSDELKYSCRLCGKKFRYRADQSKHERTHRSDGDGVKVTTTVSTKKL